MPNGKIVIFIVSEKPTIGRIEYKGIKSITESDILNAFKDERVGLSVGNRFDRAKLKYAVVVISELLAARGHQYATVKPRRIVRTRRPVYCIGREPSRANVRGSGAQLELANLDRIRSRGFVGSKLYHGFCTLPNYAERAVGKLVTVCPGRMVTLGRFAEGFWQAGSVSRENRGPDSGGVEFRAGRFFRICDAARHASFTAINGRTKSRCQGAGFYARGYQRENGRPIRSAFRTNARTSRGRRQTPRSSSDFLSGILVTVLQLRVAGYSGESQ